MSYDPATDPRWLGSEVEAIETETEVALLTAQLSRLAAMMETFRSPGWAEVANDLTDNLNATARELTVFYRNRSLTDLAFVQGQIAKVQALLDLPKLVNQRYQEKSVELEQLQNPALA